MPSPDDVGVQYEGDEWFSFLDSLFGVDSCGILDEDGNLVAPDGQVGTVGYGMAPPPENSEGSLSPEEAAAQGTVAFYRTAPFLELETGTRTGTLSGTEIAALQAAYGGPTTVLEIHFWTRVQATFVVWWPTLLAIGLVVGGVIYTVRKRKGRSRSESIAKVNAGTEPH